MSQICTLRSNIRRFRRKERGTIPGTYDPRSPYDNKISFIFQNQQPTMEMSQPVVPIGASVVQFIGCNYKPPSDDQIMTILPPPRIRLPCLLMPDESQILLSMILDGPENSGKTSMAMNLAYSCAALLDCPCIDSSACRCSASIVFRPSTERTTSFPPTCHYFPSTSTTREVPSPYSQMRKSECDYMHIGILQRIQMVYVDSVIEIVSELLCLLEDERNHIHCIIIDDLDKIASRSENRTSAVLQTSKSISLSLSLSESRLPLFFRTY